MFLGLILHIVQALILTLENKKARPVGYAVVDGAANSSWYSRSMGLLGTLLLIFLMYLLTLLLLLLVIQPMIELDHILKQML